MLIQNTEPVDYFGRKVTLVMSGVLMVIGTAIQSAAVQGASSYVRTYSIPNIIMLFFVQDVYIGSLCRWIGIWVSDHQHYFGYNYMVWYGVVLLIDLPR